MPEKKPIGERFWPKVKIAAANECWEWTAAKFPCGYGRIAEGGAARRALRAHRVSWELEHGEIPNGLWVLHTCDNRGCVNPAHLFLGTAKDNTVDAWKKGRMYCLPQNRGSDNPQARLSQLQVNEIRDLLATGVRQQELAQRFVISRQQVSRIANRQCWDAA